MILFRVSKTETELRAMSDGALGELEAMLWGRIEACGGTFDVELLHAKVRKVRAERARSPLPFVPENSLFEEDK